MDRSIKTVSTLWGDVRVKVCEKNGIKKVYPEYEDVAQICRETGLSFADTFSCISAECRKMEERQ